jgi:hypothetical protein
MFHCHAPNSSFGENMSCSNKKICMKDKITKTTQENPSTMPKCFNYRAHF